MNSTQTARLVVRYFAETPQSPWHRLVRVLTRTARQHCAGWTLDVQRIAPSTLTSPLGLATNVHNTHKLDAWDMVVQQAHLGDRLALMDADLAILRPLDDVWDMAFDLAYTVKPIESRMPLNAGVLFLRISPAVQAFIHEWALENRKMFDDPLHHQVWRPCYGGINQSALGALFHQKRASGLRVQRLPCLIWNCEDEHWGQFDPTRTRILHVKGELQRAVLGRSAASPETKPLVKVWRALEALAMQSEDEPDEPPNDPTPDVPVVLPIDLDDQMVRPVDLDTPPSPPPLSRRQRRRQRHEQATTPPSGAA